MFVERNYAQDRADLDDLIAWLQTKCPEARYAYSIVTDCLVAQYLKARGFTKVSVSPFSFSTSVSHGALPAFVQVVADPPGEYDGNTFGEALDRAKLCRAAML